MRPELPSAPRGAGMSEICTFLNKTNTLMNNLMDDFKTSAGSMCRALESMESNQCVDMAFQLALTLAAELSSAMPELTPNQ